MTEMSRSDEILSKAFGRGLTKNERHELREAYNWEKSQDEKHANRIQRSVKEFKGDTGNLNKPRHQVNCPSFQECPVDYKCRNYNPSIMACVNCKLHEVDGICEKQTIHTEYNLSRILSRERIDLDG